jgi:ATP-binding cassette, subfamily B, bacterial HlyB/CyaB
VKPYKRNMKPTEKFAPELMPTQFVWLVCSLAQIFGKSLSPDQLLREHPAPLNKASLTNALSDLQLLLVSQQFGKLKAPFLVQLQPQAGSEEQQEWRVVTSKNQSDAKCFSPERPNEAETISLAQLEARVLCAWEVRRRVEAPTDHDAKAEAARANQFGFRWFIPELLRHKRVWRDVLVASLVLQLIALTTPLFTQAIIDKVLVHRTQSTLMTIGFALVVFTMFTALLSWVRQYLVLHTGNRVDAVLGASVWEHLLRLPVRYFEQRPTGVVAARLHGVETIREFLSSAAVSLILDLPFLVICLAIMLYYSVTLSSIVVAVLLLIAIASFVMAPIFQKQLNEQFLLGARNQAFLTEHIAGFETVKSLQMEPQLRKRYADYLAALLHSSFRTKQTANSYNTAATTAEQFMTIAILLAGAWVVMNEPAFTIGMLVAFQMFASKLSQPVLRIVGLWTQFQQARLAIDRLGDLMNAPLEPYNLQSKRATQGKGRIELQGLSFRYRQELRDLFENLNLVVEAGQSVAIMGPSGVGKSTLSKLLLGFYLPTSGRIRIDSQDATHLAANELRANFGVVPQESILFSGTLLANLQAGNPNTSLEQVVAACQLAGIHQVIEALPQGYDTEIGERGVGLSGGQKQRIAIARALLKQPKILIFDEATSALDKDTAEAFAATVNQLKGKVTMLFITHALPRNLKIDAVFQMGVAGAHEFKVMNSAANRPVEPRLGDRS